MDIVSLPSLLAIPNSFGAPPSALQPGEIVDALVLALLDNGLVRLQVPDGTIDVRTAVPLTVGAKVRLAVSGTSAGLRSLCSRMAPAAPARLPRSLRARAPRRRRAPEATSLPRRPDPSRRSRSPCPAHRPCRQPQAQR